MELNLESKKTPKSRGKLENHYKKRSAPSLDHAPQRKAIKQSVIVHQIIDGPRTTQLDQLPKIG